MPGRAADDAVEVAVLLAPGRDRLERGAGVLDGEVVDPVDLGAAVGARDPDLVDQRAGEAAFVGADLEDPDLLPPDVGRLVLDQPRDRERMARRPTPP